MDTDNVYSMMTAAKRAQRSYWWHRSLYIYQREEIGMTNAEFESLDGLDDPMMIGAIEGLIEDDTIDSSDDGCLAACFPVWRIAECNKVGDAVLSLNCP